jgi:hypothetical protein
MRRAPLAQYSPPANMSRLFDLSPICGAIDLTVGCRLLRQTHNLLTLITHLLYLSPSCHCSNLRTGVKCGNSDFTIMAG